MNMGLPGLWHWTMNLVEQLTFLSTIAGIVSGWGTPTLR